jgi:hypothetical protein
MRRGAGLRLASGDERDVHLTMELVAGSSVRGQLLGPDRQPAANVGIQLLANDPSLAGVTQPSTLASSDASGNFTITDVLPGAYTLMTRPSLTQPLNARARLSASLDVVVNGDLSGVTLDLHLAQTLSGRIRTDVSDAPPQVNLRLMASRIGASGGAPNSPVTASWDAQGRFTFGDLLPGRYRLTFTGPRNAMMPRIVAQTVNGRDTADSGIEIAAGTAVTGVDLVVSTTPQSFGGTLRARQGQPPAGVYVILFPQHREAWAPPSQKIFAAQPDQTGRFIFANVPPGEYRIATVTDVEPNQWFDPALLATLVDRSRPLVVGPTSTEDISLELP